MTEHHDHRASDGLIYQAERLADRAAIQDLATAYAYAVDDRDWRRWEELFLPDAIIDYRSAGGIVGTPAELAAWMPQAMAAFEFCLHTTSTHEIRFIGEDEAAGRVHVVNRNGVLWEGRPEFVDVGAVYNDVYRRDGGRWRFAQRIEHTIYVTGGAFAAVVRDVAAASRLDQAPPFG